MYERLDKACAAECSIVVTYSKTANWENACWTNENKFWHSLWGYLKKITLVCILFSKHTPVSSHSILIPHFSLLTLHSLFLIPHYIHHFSLLIAPLHSSLTGVLTSHTSNCLFLTDQYSLLTRNGNAHFQKVILTCYLLSSEAWFPKKCKKNFYLVPLSKSLPNQVRVAHPYQNRNRAMQMTLLKVNYTHLKESRFHSFVTILGNTARSKSFIHCFLMTCF